ncbi:MAG: hypothetical protein ABI539_06030 [Acidobacteriota bacterium]
MRNKKPVQVEYKTLVVIWAGLLISQLVFMGLVYVVRPELFVADNAPAPLGDQPLVVLVFAVAALALLALSFVLRRQHLARAVVDQDASCVQTGLVLGCVLSEGCSLLGVILALAFEYRYFYFWILLGILGILFHFPRRGNLFAARFKKM